MDVSTKSVVQGKRPLGVWILTGYAIVFTGLGPVIVAVMLLASGEARAAGLGPIDWLLPLVLGICVTVAAIGAWRGNNRAPDRARCPGHDPLCVDRHQQSAVSGFGLDS